MSTTSRTNTSGKPQDYDDSTIIRRTLVERGIRPVGDENSPSHQSSTAAAITAIAQQHVDEQRELQDLNAKFAVYLDRVQYLEDYNQRLTNELQKLKESWGGDVNELQATYGPQLQALRRELDQAIRDQALQELQGKRYDYDIWQLQEQIASLDPEYDAQHLNLLKQDLEVSCVGLEQLKSQLDRGLFDLNKLQSLMDGLLQDINSLKNELDNEQLERIMIENELQTLQEHVAFQNAVYQIQRAELLSINTPVIDVSRFYRTELAHAISDIRRDFEVLFQTQTSELEEYYKVKTEQVRQEIEQENERKRLLAAEGAIEVMDPAALTASIRDGQNELSALQTENKNLQAEFDAIADDLDRILNQNLNDRDVNDRDIMIIRQEIEDKQNIINNILENNVSLRFELSTYRGLLQAEEQHLSRIQQGSQSQGGSSSSSTGVSAIVTGSPLLSSTVGGASGYLSTNQSAGSSGKPTPTDGISALSSTALSSPSGITTGLSSQYPNKSTSHGARNLDEAKKMTVQKTARGPISFETVDLENDVVVLVNEKYSGNEQSFRNWSIHRKIDQEPEIVYQFPSTFSIKPRQTVRIFSKNSSHLVNSVNGGFVADKIDTWGIGKHMVTRLIDDHNEEKAIITHVFQ